jgi:signal transduction histidine kinase
MAPKLAEIQMDGDLVERVFTNLALNAYEAMEPAGGRLTVSVQPSSEGRGGVEITFQDTGPGIPAEIREQIFNPFFTTKKSGVGLGLAIVSKIIDDHRGWLRVSSEPGNGASFQVYLPKGERDDGKLAVK